MRVGFVNGRLGRLCLYFTAGITTESLELQSDRGKGLQFTPGTSPFKKKKQGTVPGASAQQVQPQKGPREGGLRGRWAEAETQPLPAFSDGAAAFPGARAGRVVHEATAPCLGEQAGPPFLFGATGKVVGCLKPSENICCLRGEKNYSQI